MITRWFPTFIIAVWALLAVFGFLLASNPDQVILENILRTPDFSAWLGYDDLGRSIADRLIMGAQTSFIVAFWVTGLSLLVGTIIGSTSAYVGGWFDLVVVRVIDVFLAVPGILLAIALAGIMGPGIENVVIALSIVGWVGYARLARAQTLSLKHRDHVLAAKALGVSSASTLVRHIIPLMSAPLIVEATFGVAGTVIAEAGLSFLGLGVQPPEASWGSMIKDGTRYMLVAPHVVIAPGLAIMFVVLAINLLGDQLRDKLDVKSQQRNRITS